jgi:hypothetical protein
MRCRSSRRLIDAFQLLLLSSYVSVSFMEIKDTASSVSQKCPCCDRPDQSHLSWGTSILTSDARILSLSTGQVLVTFPVDAFVVVSYSWEYIRSDPVGPSFRPFVAGEHYGVETRP